MTRAKRGKGLYPLRTERANDLSTKVRGEILDSWKRSQQMGVDAGRQASRKVFDEQELMQRRQRNLALRQAASGCVQAA